MLEKAEELLFQMQLKKMAHYQAVFGFLKPRLKSLLEKVKLKTRKGWQFFFLQGSVEKNDNDDNQGDSGLGIEHDYHHEMDHEKYENYFETKICKNVSKNSALVIDNASYHSKYSEDHPKSTWKKAQYAEWLKKERSLLQKMLYDRPNGSWQKKSGRITLHIVWKKLPTNMDMK